MPRFTVDDLARITSKPGYLTVASGLLDTKPEPVARTQSLDSDEAKAGGKGRALVRIVRCGTRLLDKDNLYGSVKYLCDGLRYEGLIRADDPEAIELVVQQRKVRKGETGTEITITPL